MGSIPSLAGMTEQLAQIDGAMPRLNQIPTGCAFHPRCGHAFARCRAERPELIAEGASQVACWLYAPAAADIHG
jgi:peptide/nickel transport system ATP-binding protein